MKKIIAFALILVLFSGCASTTPIEKQDNSTETTSASPAESTNTTSEVRIMETNWDVDIYNDSTFRQFILYFFSKDELDTSNISVVIPTDFPYSYSCDECSLGDAPITMSTEDTPNILFSYNIYLNYCGFDWAALLEKYQAAQAIRNKTYEPVQGELPKTYAEAEKECEDLYLMHWDNYCKLDTTMLPQFHEYRIIITFEPKEPKEDEIINQLEVTVDGEKFIHNIGEIRLHNETVTSDSGESQGISFYSVGTHLPIRHTAGMQAVPISGFIAEEDMVLRNLEVLAGNPQIVELALRTSGGKNASADFVWDGQSSVVLSQGTTMDCVATIADPRMKMTGFDFRYFVQTEYECNGVIYQNTCHHWICHDPNPYEEYAKLFDGIDFTEYYEEYYYPIVLGIES